MAWLIEISTGTAITTPLAFTWHTNNNVIDSALSYNGAEVLWDYFVSWWICRSSRWCQKKKDTIQTLTPVKYSMDRQDKVRCRDFDSEWLPSQSASWDDVLPSPLSFIYPSAYFHRSGMSFRARANFFDSGYKILKNVHEQLINSKPFWRFSALGRKNYVFIITRRDRLKLQLISSEIC